MTGRSRYCLALVAAGAAVFSPAHGAEDCLSSCPAHKGPFGQPERDRDCILKCLREDDEAIGTPAKKSSAPPQAKLASRLRFTARWVDESRKRSLEQRFDAIPDPSFRAWAASQVEFDHGEVGQNPWRAGVTPGRVTIYDSFWTLPSASQESILAFELAKALWFAGVNPGPREARPPRQVAFEAIYREHQKSIEAMRFAAWHGADLGDLTDRDMQSWFAYACRASLFALPAPSQLPRGYSAAEWNSVRGGWPAARAAVRRFIVPLLVRSADAPR